MSTPTPILDTELKYRKHSMKPMVIDGTLYAAVAVLAALSTSLGSEEAAKYVTPEHLFWGKTWTTSIGAGALALKMFRSTTYAEHRTATAAEEATPAPAPQSQPNPPTSTHPTER